MDRGADAAAVRLMMKSVHVRVRAWIRIVIDVGWTFCTGGRKTVSRERVYVMEDARKEGGGGVVNEVRYCSCPKRTLSWSCLSEHDECERGYCSRVQRDSS